MGQTYQIKLIEEPENYGHRMMIEGLRQLYGDNKNQLGYDWLIRRYDYEAIPFWVPGIDGPKCYTVPYAVYLELYDLCQVHEDLKDGDEFILEHEGRTFRIVVNTWPTCVEAKELEQLFKKEHNIP